MSKQIFISILLLFFSRHSHASENHRILSKEETKMATEDQVSPAEIFRRTQLVLQHFAVAKEADPSDILRNINSRQDSRTFFSHLKFFSPDKFFLNFLNWNDSKIAVFQDFKSKSALDFQAEFGAKSKSKGKDNILGLKIAIDPGHMGGDFWDRQTGKYVQDPQGRKISEGLLNLQTAILLKQEFEKLGAIVKLTHERIQPVASQDWQKFNLSEIAKSELAENIHSKWFLQLVSANNSDEAMLKSFEQSQSLRQLFSESSRSDYFIKRLDLWARSISIEEFHPDVTLIIHYDVAEAKGLGVVNPKAPRQTKAFVVGGYQSDEMGSRKSRAFLARHMLDEASYQRSILLSRNIVSQLHGRLQLSLPTAADAESYVIEPGVFARNLLVPRYLTTPAVSYLECLFYDNPTDFNLLINGRHELQIDGKMTFYSDHLVSIVTAIRNGLMSYLEQVKACELCN